MKSNNNGNGQHNSASQLQFSREGKHYVENFVNAIQSTPIAVILLELAWTAGPVTFIAIQIGHYLGYGALAPFKIIIYFASYTMVAGVIGTLVKLSFDRVRKQKALYFQEAYTRVVSAYLNAFIISRDLYLVDLDATQQKYLAAEMVLSNIFIQPATLETFIESLTRRRYFAKRAHRILVLRRSGLNGHANKILTATIKQYSDELDDLQNKAPRLYDVIMAHLSGNAPTLKQGLEREPGFLERVLHAQSANDTSGMTVLDIQEIFALATEVLCGRTIPYFTFKLSGNKSQVNAFKTLEKNRHEMRILISGFYSRINALSNLLTEENEDLPRVESETHKHLVQDTLSTQVETLDAICFEAFQLIKKPFLTLPEREQLQDYTTELALALELYKKLVAQAIRVHRKIQQFRKASHKWQSLTSTNTEQNSARLQTSKVGKGLSLEVRAINPSEKQKLIITEKLSECLDDNKFFSRRMRRQGSEYKLKHAVNLALDTALVLDEELNISDPLIQTAIQVSPEAPLNTLELGTSAHYKIGVAVALCGEVKNDMTKAAQEMVKVMLQVYKIELDDESMQFLHQEYGVDMDVINKLKQHADVSMPISLQLTNSLPVVPPIKKQWQRCLDASLARLKKASKNVEIRYRV